MLKTHSRYSEMSHQGFLEVVMSLLNHSLKNTPWADVGTQWEVPTQTCKSWPIRADSALTEGAFLKRQAPKQRVNRGFPVSLFLEDAPLRSFVASHIPRFFVRPKKKKEREKMATSYGGVDRHFRGPGQQKSWCKGKTSGDATRKCSKG